MKVSSAHDPWTALCRQHLPKVSRTFAITIPVLREPLQGYVGLAYLLCRLADTAEDHPDFSETERNEWLSYLEGEIRTGHRPAPRIWKPHPNPDYQSLVDHGEEILEARRHLPDAVRSWIDACVLEMLEGMREFPGRRPGRVTTVCSSLEELDRYCHVVAGTVGILLTRLFSTRLGLAWATPDRERRGARFGLGLQVVNILKDRTHDQARGISYCPDLEPRSECGLPMPVVQHAFGHLREAEAFIQSIPVEYGDLRAFCLIPHSLALRTLEHLLQGHSKIPRTEVLEILDQSRLLSRQPSPPVKKD